MAENKDITISVSFDTHEFLQRFQAITGVSIERIVSESFQSGFVEAVGNRLHCADGDSEILDLQDFYTSLIISRVQNGVF